MSFEKLSIKEESKRFKDHLFIEGNERIIFSGIFGIGKTYFIDNFFEQEDENFISIKLNPVNYSVSPNQDIFELIKFDIGYQLFSKNPEFEKIKFEKVFSSSYYLVENYKKVISLLIKNLSKLDHRIDAIAKSTVELGEKIKKFKEEIEKDEEIDLKNFLDYFKNQIGTFREENSITELINNLVETLKINNPEKKIVLVIDDLDRIDPEHIFRIMNVFSAHFDFYNLKNENKFGFNNVVLICDITNIRGIFHNKYGTNIDFSGYIDKFYSNEIFYYDFVSVINDNIDKFLSSIVVDNNLIIKHLQSSSNYYKDELIFLLRHMVTANSISMRALINFLKSKVILDSYTIKSYNSADYFNSDSTPILIVLQIIEKIVGGQANFINILNKTLERYPSLEITTRTSYWRYRIGNLIMLIDQNQNSLDVTKEDKIYINKEFDIKVQYKIHPSDNYEGLVGKAERIGHTNDNFSKEEISFHETITKRKIPYFQLLIKAYLSIKEISKESVY